MKTEQVYDEKFDVSQLTKDEQTMIHAAMSPLFLDTFGMFTRTMSTLLIFLNKFGSMGDKEIEETADVSILFANTMQLKLYIVAKQVGSKLLVDSYTPLIKEIPENAVRYFENNLDASFSNLMGAMDRAMRIERLTDLIPNNVSGPMKDILDKIQDLDATEPRTIEAKAKLVMEKTGKTRTEARTELMVNDPNEKCFECKATHCFFNSERDEELKDLG